MHYLLSHDPHKDIDPQWSHNEWIKMKSDSLFIYKSKDQNPKDQNHNTKTLSDINDYNIP